MIKQNMCPICENEEISENDNYCKICGYKLKKIKERKMMKMNSEILRISSKSNPNAVAGAIVGVVEEKGKVELQGIGAGAVNQAIKAIAIARGFVAPSGVDLVCIPAFTTATVEGEERTGMKFIVRGQK